jgi:hypothetical protein
MDRRALNKYTGERSGLIWLVFCEASQLVFLLPGHRWERGGGLLPPPPLRREGIATESIGEEEAPL